MGRLKKLLRENFRTFKGGLALKIILPVLFAVSVFSLPGYAVYRAEQITDATDQSVTFHNNALIQLGEMDAALRNEHLAIYEFKFGGNPGAEDDFLRARDEVERLHDETASYADSPAQLAALEDCEMLHRETAGIFLGLVVPAMNAGADQNSLQGIDSELQSRYDRIDALRGEVADLFVSDQQEALFDHAASHERVTEYVWISTSVAVVIGLLFAGIMARRLVRPVKRISAAARSISSGDLSRRVGIKGRDELAELGNSFNAMADSLEYRTSQLEREKARIRSIHQSIGDGIIVTDRSGAIVSVNPAAERALGRTALELERTTNTGIPELQRIIARTISQADMVKCWEAKGCAKADCPSHSSPDRRCWLQCGTFCYNQIQGTFKQKRDACERCDVFVKNAVIQFEVNINKLLFSGQAVPILDDLGQEKGKTIVLHDVTELRRAKEDAENIAAQLAVLNSVSRAAAGSLDLDTIFDASLSRMIGGTMADAAFIHTWEAGGAEMLLAASQGLDDSFRALLAKLPPQTHGGGCPGHVVECGEAVLENNLDQRGVAAQAAIDAGFHSYVGAPLIVKKQIVGVVSLVAVEPDAFTSDDKSLLSMIGMKVGLAVENANLFLKTIENAKQEQARSRIAATLASNFEVEANFDKFVAGMHELVDFDHIGIVVSQGDGTIAKVIVPSDFKPPLDEAPSGMNFTSGTAIDWVMKNRRPVICDDISKDMKFKERVKLAKDGLKSQMVIPLIANGKVLGSLNMVSVHVAAYNENTVKQLQSVVDQLALAVANQKLFDEISSAKKEWETTFDSASEGIVMVSKDHRIKRMNNTAAAMFGGEVKELLGRPCYEVVHKTSEVPAACLMRQSCATSVSSTGEQETEDGSLLEVTVDAVYDDKGEVMGAVHFLRDVTDSRKLREQLVQSEKMIAVGQLVAGVAHEINNPLTGVIGYSQLLLARDLDERTRRDVEQINHEAERAGKIVRHLLSFARKHEPERRLVNINQVVSEALDLKAYDLRVNNIVADTKLANNLPVTAVDPHQLQQVFLNLIANAEQAILDEPAGGGRLLISTETQGKMIRVVFTDSGPGIPEETSDRVFDPFFTTKDVGRGTGLGLSVCYGILEEHGGKIWVDKSFSDGARMVVDLPISSGVLNDVTAESEQPRTTQDRVGKILLVDDEAAIRDVVSKLLKRTGHSVETARDGQVALRMLRQRHYDCVVTDVKMPGVDGTALHRAIRESDPELAGTFIFISGDTVSPETREYLSETERPYLAKPFKLEELESLLQQVLASQSD